MTQHDTLTAERWSRFTLDQQVLMIANERQRATPLLSDPDPGFRRRCYERVLRLVDLTVGTRPRRAFLRELLRWRDLVAELYVATEAERQPHLDALRALLLLRPEASRQIPYLLG
jgi:hypothetical protein